MTKGFIYILSNPAMPGLLKIGLSQKVPDQRAEELFTTGVPQPFIVEYYCIVDDCSDLEEQVHGELRHYRVHPEREFFQIDLARARTVVESFAKPELTWARPKTQRGASGKAADSRGGGVCPQCKASYARSLYCPRCRVRLR